VERHAAQARTGATGPAPWRLLLGDGTIDRPRDGATNMALDQALLDAVCDGATPTLRFYRWSPATLSFGRNQPGRGLYDRDEAARRGIEFVRRPTGGQAVLHDDELTYAVVAPVAAVGKPRAAYRRINSALVQGLGEIGLTARVAGARAGADGAAGGGKAWTEACFRRPESGEVVVAGRKLVGSAQRTQGRTILQHGSILLGGSQAAAEELLLEPPRVTGREVEGWTTVERELGVRPDPESLVEALVGGFERVFGIRLAPSSPSSRESAGARELRSRFASEAWTWRR